MRWKSSKAGPLMSEKNYPIMVGTERYAKHFSQSLTVILKVMILTNKT